MNFLEKFNMQFLITFFFLLTCTSGRVTTIQGCTGTRVLLVCVGLNGTEALNVEQVDTFQKIMITMSDIADLKSEDLGKFGNVEWISITNTTLSVDGIFEKMKRLKHAELSHDISITTFHIVSHSLTELTISHSGITYLDNHTFGEAHNLEFISLVGNRITGIVPDAFSNLFYLKYLNLSYNAIEWHDYKKGKWIRELVEKGVKLQLHGNPICSTDRQRVPPHMAPILVSACHREANLELGSPLPVEREEQLQSTRNNDVENGSINDTTVFYSMLTVIIVLDFIIGILVKILVVWCPQLPNGKNQEISVPYMIIPNQGDSMA